MSRFSPAIPKAKEDPGIRTSVPSIPVFKRTGSTVLTIGGTDPGTLLPAVEGVQFKRTGDQVGPWQKKQSTDSAFQGVIFEKDEKTHLEEVSNHSNQVIENKPRSNSDERIMMLQTQITEERSLEEFRERSNSIPQPIPAPERKLGIGVFSTKGTRKKNEDTHLALVTLPNDTQTSLFAIFDGHGGKNASHFCQKKMAKIISSQKTYSSDKRQALIDGFIETDKKFNEKLYNDGTTAVVALLCEGNKLYVANVGDSRCILIRKDKTIIQLSNDHKPESVDEKRRIEESGHEVTKDSSRVNGKKITVYRIDHELGVARSIGDVNYKDNTDLPPEKQAVTCYPEIIEDVVNQGDFLVLACDGLWDVMTNQEVADYIFNNIQTTNIQQLSENLVEEALQRGSNDNITLVLVSIL